MGTRQPGGDDGRLERSSGSDTHVSMMLTMSGQPEAMRRRQGLRPCRRPRARTCQLHHETIMTPWAQTAVGSLMLSGGHGDTKCCFDGHLSYASQSRIYHTVLWRSTMHRLGKPLRPVGLVLQAHSHVGTLCTFPVTDLVRYSAWFMVVWFRLPVCPSVSTKRLHWPAGQASPAPWRV